MTRARTAGMRVHAKQMLLAAAAMSLFGAPGALGQALVLPDGRNAEHAEWQVQGNFSKDKDISGLACTDDRSCFAVTDEKSAVLPFALDRTARTITVTGQPIELPSGGEEADIEAAAFDGKTFFFTGSHAMSRNRCEHQDSRYRLYRAIPGAAPGSFDVVEPSGKLEELIARQPRLAPHAGKCLGDPDKGVDVEGLAVRDGVVQVGFRAPSLDGKAFVLSVKADELFSTGAAGPSSAVLHEIALGNDTGVRDMAPVGGGFLVLAGPSAGEGGRFSVYLWNGRASTERLGEFKDLTKDGEDAKTEGLMLVGETSEAYDVLVVFDGVKNGWPQEFRIPKSR
jgi:hypothetical protein